jgi:hypothetical protein
VILKIKDLFDKAGKTVVELDQDAGETGVPIVFYAYCSVIFSISLFD